MYKHLITLIRGRSYGAAEAMSDANALPILHQQLRDCARSIEEARRAVAMVMAYSQREQTSGKRISTKLSDLETRAIQAIESKQDRLAAEAAGMIAQLEVERETSTKAVETYEAEIVRLRQILTESEKRLRDLKRGERLATATDKTLRLHNAAPFVGASGLDEAERTLNRLQERQAHVEATRSAIVELSSSTSADAMRDRLAAAGCGAPMGPDASAVLARLTAKVA